MLYCPYCKSDRVVKNGHTSNKKQQWICKTCNKHFLNDAKTSKRYPRTSLPFPFIAKMLYTRMIGVRNGKMNMRRFRERINSHLRYLEFRTESPDYKKDISRQTIHYWIKTYGNNLERIISFEEAKNLVHDLFKKSPNFNYAIQKNMDVPVETVVYEKRPHKQALELLQKFLGGKEKSLEFLRNDEKFFDVLLEETSIIDIPKIKKIWTR
jgi:hypothetical protein